MDKKAVAAPAPAAVTHIVLETEWAHFVPGKVLAADPDLIKRIEKDGAKCRPATPKEIDLGANS